MATLPVRPHCMNVRWIRCQADLNSFHLGELEETTGMPPYYMDEDYPAGSEITEPLPQGSNWRGSESSTTENDVHIWRYALIVVHARNEWMNEWQNVTFHSSKINTNLLHSQLEERRPILTTHHEHPSTSQNNLPVGASRCVGVAYDPVRCRATSQSCENHHIDQCLEASLPVHPSCLLSLFMNPHS